MILLEVGKGFFPRTSHALPMPALAPGATLPHLATDGQKLTLP